jgi:hypothetical protein
METCPITKNFMKIPRFGREGNPYWRCILLFQRKFLNAEAGPIRLADIAAGRMKGGIRAWRGTHGQAHPRSSSNAAIS